MMINWCACYLAPNNSSFSSSLIECTHTQWHAPTLASKAWQTRREAHPPVLGNPPGWSWGCCGPTSTGSACKHARGSGKRESWQL